ncbi:MULTISPECIES: ABC transporter permease [Mumia]|uniref:ABC transporter permease n=1 Tax=Mumia TaxID=1546255 RepID=UPI00141E41E0|nr:MULTISPECIES: ABC transporter permease [unclassified Mumia]QMW66036.1 ABC transporter permease [Mumia sp. ZJ1417]
MTALDTPTRTATAPAPTSRPTSQLHNIGLVFGRELRPVVRDPFSVVFGIIQPLFFLGLFTPLLVASSGQSTADTLQWFVPGVIVMLSLFGTSTTGANLQFEMQTGSHERTLVSPLSRSSLMIGRALKEIVPTIVQALVIVGVAVPFGFRPDVAGLVVGLAVLSVFCVGLGALSYALALAVKENQWAFWGVQQTLLFPLMLLAGILLPLQGAPGWLEVASKINPLTYVVDAERALIAGTWDGDAVAGAVAAAITCVVGLVIGAKAMRASS